MAADETSQSPETHRKLVVAGIRWMRAQGFHAPPVDVFCTAAGVTNGAFFHYFKRWEAIAKTTAMLVHGKNHQDFAKASAQGAWRLAKSRPLGKLARGFVFSRTINRELGIVA